MIKLVLLLFLVIPCICSCSLRNQDTYLDLDQSIKLQDIYDKGYQHVKDSLTLLFNSVESDSTKWETAFALEKILNYHDLDSCFHYIKEMKALCTKDKTRQAISESCYAQYLYKTNNYLEALDVLKSINVKDLSREGIGLFCDAAYHVFRDSRPLSGNEEENMDKILDYWWKNDSTNIKCTYYYHLRLKDKGEDIDLISILHSQKHKTLNDLAKIHDFLGREYLKVNNTIEAKKHFAFAAECDMRLSAKTYNALYELAQLLLKEGDIKRAERYMRITVEDAKYSKFKTRQEDAIRLEVEILDTMVQQQRENKKAYLISTIAISLLLIVSIISLVLQNRYSSRLTQSREKLSEVSKIKDSFLAIYMEKCVDYLNKVDKYRSSLRHAVKHEGPEAAIAMLRAPSFADGEFKELLINFDSAFLGIFPDFVDKVNMHMQEGFELTMPAKGVLSNELRILALIRMGITKRQKIAKVLNMSVTTVYSYHCNLQKNSLHPDSSFDKVIANL